MFQKKLHISHSVDFAMESVTAEVTQAAEDCMNTNTVQKSGRVRPKDAAGRSSVLPTSLGEFQWCILDERIVLLGRIAVPAAAVVNVLSFTPPSRLLNRPPPPLPPLLHLFICFNLTSPAFKRISLFGWNHVSEPAKGKKKRWNFKFNIWLRVAMRTRPNRRWWEFPWDLEAHRNHSTHSQQRMKTLIEVPSLAPSSQLPISLVAPPLSLPLSLLFLFFFSLPCL